MAYGPSAPRNGGVQVNQPAGGAANSAITVTGTVWPAGYVVETVWSLSQQPPATGWGAATAVAGTGGGSWTRTTTRPASAGQWILHARIQLRPLVTGYSARVTIT